MISSSTYTVNFLFAIHHFNVPVFYKGKYVVTIHDLIHQHHQMKRATTLNPLFYRVKQYGYNKTFSNALLKSNKIITVSNFVKNQLEDEWKVKSDKISVMHEAVDDHVLNVSQNYTEEMRKSVLQKFGVKSPFIFYVGNAHPHKNVEGLIKAFLNLREKYQYLQLVLSGNDHYFWKRIKEEYKQKDIIYTGYISDAQLVAFYKSAKAFVMPSFEEGFGIPILEAMANNCPVICSDIGALKEVGSEAALYFDPHDISDIEEKIFRVINNKKINSEIIEKGEKRYKQFSWKKLAEDTLKIYESARN